MLQLSAKATYLAEDIFKVLSFLLEVAAGDVVEDECHWFFNRWVRLHNVLVFWTIVHGFWCHGSTESHDASGHSCTYKKVPV
jgi:hypothetical protein